MANNIPDLKERVLNAEHRVAYLESLLDAFWTGNIPEKASFNHMILAASGRERLNKKAKRAVLLDASQQLG